MKNITVRLQMVALQILKAVNTVDIVRIVRAIIVQ